MATGVHGDFQALDRLAARIREVGSTQFQNEMGKALGAVALKQLADEFRQSKDPYGRAWKRPILRDGKPLQDTGRLQNSFQAKPTPQGFSVSTNVYYARTHQLGAGVDGSPIATIVPVEAKRLRWRTRDGRWHTRMAVKIPKRQIVPTPETGGVGSKWGKALNEEADALMQEKLDIE